MGAVTNLQIGVGVVVLAAGYYAYTTLKTTTLAGAAKAVDQRGTGSTLGAAQTATTTVVQKVADAIDKMTGFDPTAPTPLPPIPPPSTLGTGTLFPGGAYTGGDPFKGPAFADTAGGFGGVNDFSNFEVK